MKISVRVLVLSLLGGMWLSPLGVLAEEKAEKANPPEQQSAPMDYEAARWHPLHFKPAIETAKDEECLACHQEVLENSVKPASAVGIKTEDSLAWYQTLEIYQGAQDTFHRRHLVTPLAKELMNLKCNTCHQGYDPREETPTIAGGDGSFSMRKMVNPETTCLKCHGQMNFKIMGLPAVWETSGEMMGNNCLICHQAVRTVRHQVNYLNAEAIEKNGTENSDSCYGCHGGRSWYRIPYPYPRHAWPAMGSEVPVWAKDRPTQSEERFRLPQTATIE